MRHDDNQPEHQGLAGPSFWANSSPTQLHDAAPVQANHDAIGDAMRAAKAACTHRFRPWLGKTSCCKRCGELRDCATRKRRRKPKPSPRGLRLSRFSAALKTTKATVAKLLEGGR